jgi:hypothetical protein
VKGVRIGLFVVRWVLPSALTFAGLVLIAFNPGGSATREGGMGVFGAGLAAFLFAFLARVSMSGDVERQNAEEAARRFFDEHGHWPDEDPSRARGRRAPAPPTRR